MGAQFTLVSTQQSNNSTHTDFYYALIRSCGKIPSMEDNQAIPDTNQYM